MGSGTFVTVRDVVAWLPRRVRKEFRTRGGDTRFLMWVSFLAAFLWARVWVTYFGKTPMVGVGGFEIGHKTVIFGYHPHHIVTGIVFLAMAGWIGLHYQGKVITRIAGILYGAGLGLIVDEAGIVVEGITYRRDFPEMFVLVVTISAWLMSTVYFPAFWKGVDKVLARTYSRVAVWVAQWRHPTPPAADPVASADDSESLVK